MAAIRILGICGSLRVASTNAGLLRAAAKSFPPEVTFSIADISSLPLFNQDLSQPLPAPVVAFKQQVEAADGFLFACPEYNWGYTAVLKNAVDWVSFRPNAFAGKTCSIVGSGGMMGANKAQMQFRQVCTELKMTTTHESASLVRFVQPSPFDDKGDLSESVRADRIVPVCNALAAAVSKLKK